MANLLSDILGALEWHKETTADVQAVVITNNIGELSYVGEKDSRDILLSYLNIPLSWETAAPLLDYTYDSGFGSQDCHSLYIYTPNNVYYIHEYDGATSVESIPRNPSAPV